MFSCKLTPWKWTRDCSTAFSKAKTPLSTAPVLAHYDPNLKLCLAGDASAYGVGAVLSHVYPDGSERPIAYASRTLNSSERNYAQVEKEALSLIFGVKRFHQYIYAREFTLVTDHKPLTTILGSKNTIPSLAAARLQRWALLLAGYSYSITFKPTSTHSNADGLSRLPLKNATSLGYLPDATNFKVAQIDALPVTAAELEAATRKDSILCKFLYYTRSGWPNVIKEPFKLYWDRRLELSIEGSRGTGSYTTCTSPEGYGRTPSRSSRGSANESTGSQPFLVARFGQGCRRTCEDLYCLSSS